MTNHRTKIKRLLLAAVATVVLDQAAKLLVLRYLSPGLAVELIPGFFNLVLTHNPGAAFGLLTGWPPLLLAGLALLVLFLLGWLVYAADARETAFFSLVGLTAGGAAGNVIDRVRLGAVVDFLDFHFKGYHWPAFNVADIAICLGCFLMVVYLIRAEAGSPAAKAGRRPKAPAGKGRP